MEHADLGIANTQEVEAKEESRNSKTASAKTQINFPKCVGSHHLSARAHTHRYTGTCAQEIKCTNINRTSEPGRLEVGNLDWL